MAFLTFSKNYWNTLVEGLWWLILHDWQLEGCQILSSSTEINMSLSFMLVLVSRYCNIAIKMLQETISQHQYSFPYGLVNYLLLFTCSSYIILEFFFWNLLKKLSCYFCCFIYYYFYASLLPTFLYLFCTIKFVAEFLLCFSIYYFFFVLIPQISYKFQKPNRLYTRYLAFLKKWENIILDALYLLFNWLLTFCIRIISWLLGIKNLSIADWMFLYDETTSFILYNIFLFLMVNNWLVN